MGFFGAKMAANKAIANELKAVGCADTAIASRLGRIGGSSAPAQTLYKGHSELDQIVLNSGSGGAERLAQIKRGIANDPEGMARTQRAIQNMEIDSLNQVARASAPNMVNKQLERRWW